MTPPTVIRPAWLQEPALASVMAALTADLGDGPRPIARFVGGCVRNALLAGGPTDIDIAVDMTPPRTIARLQAAGLKAIPTGVEHGTVTTLAGEEPIEVTSLRRDVETDGRRAVVAFTRDWREDAERRDFTMNALYADANGVVFDPLGSGLADLAVRRVRFIGRAEDRIREDYLRILRYFRFLAWYGDPSDLDADDLTAVASLISGISGLARERIGQEMRKLLAAPDPVRALSLMAQAGALAAVLPGARADRAAALVAEEARHRVAPDWRRRLLALAPSPEENAEESAEGAPPGGDGLEDALRLSRAEATALKRMRAALTPPPAEAGYRAGAEAARDALLIRAAGGEPVSAADFRAAAWGAKQRLPLTAQDLMAEGLPPGPALGRWLRIAERDWIDNNFSLDTAALFRKLRDEGSE